jgi:hypothetical protein
MGFSKTAQKRHSQATMDPRVNQNEFPNWMVQYYQCLSGSKMLCPIATLWDDGYGMVWHKMQDPGTQISDDLARYYQCFILLLCKFNMFAVPEQNRGMSQCSLF